MPKVNSKAIVRSSQITPILIVTLRVYGILVLFKKTYAMAMVYPMPTGSKSARAMVSFNLVTGMKTASLNMAKRMVMNASVNHAKKD
jgi:hypothetical protein